MIAPMPSATRLQAPSERLSVFSPPSASASSLSMGLRIIRFGIGGAPAPRGRRAGRGEGRTSGAGVYASRGRGREEPRVSGPLARDGLARGLRLARDRLAPDHLLLLRARDQLREGRRR